LGLAIRLNYLVAILFAQVVVIGPAFLAYRRWVFEPGSSWRSDFARFITVWSGGAIGGVLATPVLVEVLGWQPMTAQLIAIAAVSGASFVAHRLFTFGRVRQNRSQSANERTY
jgi:putative flippase GtrA